MQHRFIISLFAVAAVGACATNRTLQESSGQIAPAPADSIQAGRVLHGLRPGVEIAGRPPVRWTLEERMAFYHVPAISIAVIDAGKIAWVRAIGIKEAGKPDSVTPATLFQAASLSKPITATAMLRLVQRGTLDLDTDVNRYLTSWKVPENRFTATEKVTLRRIVSHSAGLTVNGFRGHESNTPLPTLVQVLNGVAPANSPPVVVETFPGAIGRYSGGGVTVMQQLLVDVTHTPFAELMEREVLRPSQMRMSTFEQPLPTSRAGEAASGHNADGSVIAGGRNIYVEQAAAGLWTTATDLATWAIAIADSYAGRSNALLSQSMTKQMLTAQKDNFGLGVSVKGSGDSFNFNHSGSNVGFRSLVGMFPARGVGVAIFTNGTNGSSLAAELVRAIAEEYNWPDLRAKRVTPVTLDASVAAAIAGNYTLRVGPGRPAEVRLEEGRLVLHGPAASVQELIPESDTHFVTAERGWQVDFTRDASGRVTGIQIILDGETPPVTGIRS